MTVKNRVEETNYRTEDMRRRNSIVFWTITFITIISTIPRFSFDAPIGLYIQLGVMLIL